MAYVPGSKTLPQELDYLKRRLDDLTRRGGAYPVCQAVLPTAVTANGRTLAGSSWTATVDPFGMFTAGAPASVTIPASGCYWLQHRTSYTGLSSGGVAASVYLNGTTIDHQVAIFSASASGSTDNSATAEREVQLVAGDVLHWGFYTSASCTLRGGPGGLYTEFRVRYVGPT